MSENSRKNTAKAWHTAAFGRGILGENSTAKDGKQQAEWIEATQTATLDSHVTRLRVTARSKRW